MVFYEKRQLADDSHELSNLIVFKLGKMSQNLTSVAVMIGALRLNLSFGTICYHLLFKYQNIWTAH